MTKPFLAALALAWPVAAATFSVGGGLNLSTMNISENDEESRADLFLRPGLNAGAGLDFLLGPAFALASGLSLETRGQGAKSSAEDTSLMGTSEAELVYKLLYLQVPLHLKAALPVGRSAGLQLFAGPEIGIKLSSSATVETSFLGQRFKSTQSIDAKPFDFGVSFGGGLRFPLQTVGLFLETSYYLGFVDVAELDDDPETPEDESEETFHSRNRNFKLRAGIYKDL